MEWFIEGMRTISTMCIAVSVVESVAGEGEFSESLRMLCGAMVALSIIQSAVNALRNIL